VDQLFSHRRAVEIVTPNQQWWRPDPDMDLIELASEKIQALDREKDGLLTRLLGPDWEVGIADSVRQGISISFDGPVLADVTPETQQAVRSLERRMRDKIQEYRRERQGEGKAVNEADLARLRLQTREELTKVLSPSQLEEYLLRYSHNAGELREQMRGFDASQEEFRKVFNAVDPVDNQIQLLAGATDPSIARQREGLEQQRERAVKDALGDSRYQFYRLNGDPVFQQARDTAEELGMAAEKVLPLYEINHATEQERQRVLADTSLSADEQSEELASIYQQQLDSLRKVLGEDGFKKLQASRPR
jgi:uncharacterized protein YdcH (DUF465 family)